MVIMDAKTIKALNLLSVLEVIQSVCKANSEFVDYSHDKSTDTVLITMNGSVLYKCQLSNDKALTNLKNIKNALLELCPSNSAMKIPNLPGCASRPSNVVRAFF